MHFIGHNLYIKIFPIIKNGFLALCDLHLITLKYYYLFQNNILNRPMFCCHDYFLKLMF